MSTNTAGIELVAPSPEDQAEAQLFQEFPRSIHGQYQLPIDFVWAAMPDWRRRIHLKAAGVPEHFMASALEWRFDMFRPRTRLAIYKSVFREVKALFELGTTDRYIKEG